MQRVNDYYLDSGQAIYRAKMAENIFTRTVIAGTEL